MTTVTPSIHAAENADQPKSETRTAVLGAGCFWCVEAVLEQIKGVKDVESGYMGGDYKDPTYELVCSQDQFLKPGQKGHVEVVKVDYDPSVISYRELLIWFFKLHDPTTLNQQGHDKGTQYRSAIFFANDEEKAEAEKLIAELTEKKAFLAPIVTEVTAASTYYKAEEKHQDFYRLNAQSNGYCKVVITPKLDKLGLESK